MNDDQHVIIIGQQGSLTDHIQIRIVNRSNPNSTDFWDGNWLNAQIDIHTGGFNGSYFANLRSNEIISFFESVKKISTSPGEATFATMEGQLFLKLLRNLQGHLKIIGTAIDEAGIGNRLEFKFEIDQTFLTPLLKQLEIVLAEFPVVGTRTT